jgi:hypothetical protein
LFLEVHRQKLKSTSATTPPLPRGLAAFWRPENVTLDGMSLAIREQEVVAVLLVDGWHEVDPGSFYIDAYEYIHDDGSVAAGGIGVGFHAEDAERGEMAGPLSSVLAVKIVR